MSIDFKRIKKYSKTSNNFDEKLECLNKELKKTGLDEMANTTGGLYVGSQTNPNSGYAQITAKNFNGERLAMSGDTSLGQGNFGGATIRADGAALSPPHPVTGERITASTKGGLAQGGIKIARPGERPTPSSRMTGPIMWYWNPSGGAGSGSWESLEFNDPEVHGNGVYPSYQAGWGYWGSGAFGFLLLRSDGASFSGIMNTLNDEDGKQFHPKDSVPTTTVITRNDLGDSGFLPINIPDLSKQAFDWLKDKAKDFAKNPTPLGLLDIGIDAFTDLVAKALGVGNAKDTYDDYVDDFIPNLTKGKNPPGSSKDNPKDPYRDGMNDETKNNWEDIFKEYQKELESGVPPNLAKVPKNYQDTANKNGDIGNITGTPDTSAGVDDGFEDNGDGTTTFHKAYDFDGIADMTIQAGNPLVNIGTFGYGVYKGAGTSIITSPEFDIKKPLKSGKSPTMHIGITFDNETGKYIPNYKPGTVKESLDESVKLGHFEPEVLNVNIDDLRKGIAPEFPKDPPPEMIDGYAANSRLAPKTIKGSPFIKITKKDVAKNHLLTDKQISDFMNDIKMINDYIKKNPADLIYAQQRYPKHDPRLAQLNWQMDQMLDAGKEYVDKQFPENQRLFNRIQKKIKNTIDQTDPKNFKGTKLPKFDNTSLEDFKRKKEVYSRFMKKPVKTKNRFHLDMKDVKKTHLKKLAARKIKEEENKKEKKVIQEIAKKHKSDWRKDLREDFTNITTGNKVGQTFRHNPTGATFTSSGGLGGVESTPKTVTLDLGLDGKFTVDAPTYDQLALAGYAKPIVMQNKKLEDTNPKLDASQEFAKKVGADYMMNARVKDAISSALSDDLGYKSTEDILAEVGDVWTYEEYMEMMNAIGDRAAAASLPITKEILQYGPGGTKTGDVPISLIDAQEAITNARTKAEAALTAAWERYNKIPEPQDGFGGGQGNPTNRRGSGFDRKGALDSSGYGMDPSRDTETEARPVKNDEDGKARVDKFNKEVENIQKFNDKMRENNINKIKEYIKSLKLNVTYEQLLEKGAIKTKGGIVAIDDAGKGNIRVGVFKGSDVYTKDKFVFHHGDKYTSEIESFNTEEGVKEIPTMPDVLQKWQSAQNRRNNVSKLVDISKRVFNQIKSDANPFRPLDTITKQARINASKQISKLLMSTVKNYKGGKYSGMETPAAVMLAYNDFALNKARGKGSTTSNRLELNNIVSKSDNKIIKDKLRVNQVALSNYQKDPSNSLNRDQVILGAQSAFELAVNNNPQLRATFGGAAGTFPKAKIVGNNIVFEKSYGFQHSGSAQNINPVQRILMDVMGLPPDTTGGSSRSLAPFAAAIGLQGDDIHARYYNTMSREERGGKPTSIVHSLYNVPDMHYKYTVPISELIQSSKSKTTSKAVEKIKSMSKARNQSLSLDEPIVRRKKKRG